MLVGVNFWCCGVLLIGIGVGVVVVLWLVLFEEWVGLLVVCSKGIDFVMIVMVVVVMVYIVFMIDLLGIG